MTMIEEGRIRVSLFDIMISIRVYNIYLCIKNVYVLHSFLYKNSIFRLKLYRFSAYTYTYAYIQTNIIIIIFKF